MAFKKKKPEIIDTEKGTSSDGLQPPRPAEQKQEEVLSEEMKRLQEIAKHLHKFYGGYMTPSDVANLPRNVYDSEILVVLVAIFDEIRSLRQEVQD